MFLKLIKAISLSIVRKTSPKPRFLWLRLNKIFNFSQDVEHVLEHQANQKVEPLLKALFVISQLSCYTSSQATLWGMKLKNLKPSLKLSQRQKEMLLQSHTPVSLYIGNHPLENSAGHQLYPSLKLEACNLFFKNETSIAIKATNIFKYLLKICK